MGIGSREGAKERRDREVLIKAVGTHVVGLMDAVMALPDNLRIGARNMVEMNLALGTGWLVTVKLLHDEGPAPLRASAPLREPKELNQ